MNVHAGLRSGILATLVCLSNGFGQATRVAAFDVNIGASETQSGFQGLASAISGSQNNITLTTTPVFNGSTGYRDRGTGGALATATQQGLMRDLCFFNSTSPDLTAVTFALTGLEASRQYEIGHFMYNQGAFQRRATFYETSVAGPLLGSYATPGNTPEQGGFTFTITANASGEASYVVVGDDPSGSSVIFNGMTVGLLPVTAPPQPLEFTAINLDGNKDEITLTWKSNPGQTYGLYWSDNLETFEANIAPVIPAHPTETVTTFGPFTNPGPEDSKLFFQIGPPDFEDPALRNLFGNGSSVTLVFSEAMAAGLATNPANFLVIEEGGGPVELIDAKLGEDGTVVTLTTATPLGIGSAYSVTIEALTDRSGRPLPANTSDTFATWDNNPNGVKVFILAGQSNMQGHGRNETGVNGVAGALGSLRYQVNNDPENYSQLVDQEEDWIARDDVKVWWRDSDLGSARTVKKGNLEPIFGVDSARFGPEYGFGWVLGEFYGEPVLLLKTAWGGKSLDVDFRPPSAVANRGGIVGPYYNGMIDCARDVLGNLGTEFPEWSGLGYQIVGFAWHQGWNDGGSTGPFADYEVNLADLILDVRSEFGLPNLPISIGNSGFGGFAQTAASRLAIINAQLAVSDPAKYPAFQDTVFTAETRSFWRGANVSPLDQGYHWNQNGETYWLLGKAMGEGMTGLLAPR